MRREKVELERENLRDLGFEYYGVSLKSLYQKMTMKKKKKKEEGRRKKE